MRPLTSIVVRSSIRTAILLLTLSLAFFAGARTVSAQNKNAVETLNLDQAMTVDDNGIATLKIKMTLTAAQFVNWQQKYGPNKSLLKRDMGKVLSMYDTYDWDVSEKQMDREITISVKARGAIVNKGGGTYEFRVPKDWRGGERHDNTFTFNYVEGIGGGAVAQTNVRLTAPDKAYNFREQLSEAGEKVIQYSLPVAGKSGWMLTAGLIFAVLGAGLIGATLLGKTSSAPAAHRSSAQTKGALKHNDHAAAPAVRSKPVDPPSMSTIPLEQTTIGTSIPERKESIRRN